MGGTGKMLFPITYDHYPNTPLHHYPPFPHPVVKGFVGVEVGRGT
jgi:hypothetical protein